MDIEQLHLIAVIAGQRVAIPARMIESVIEIDEVTPVPLSPPHLAGLFALRSRVMAVVDSLAALGLGACWMRGERPAVVVVVDGHLYGVLVDQVEEVVSLPGELLPINAGASGGWARVARGLVEHEGQALLVIEPDVLIGGTAIAA